MFSLLDFCHSKVEAAAMDDVKLVGIEFKIHDPQNIVENHLAQFNMKRYVHEISPYEEIFRGVKSYEEVQERFLTLPPDQQASFIIFQNHRNNNLPKVLQGEQVVTPPSQEAKSIGSEVSHSGKHKVRGNLKELGGIDRKIRSIIVKPARPLGKIPTQSFPEAGIKCASFITSYPC
jgi:hypothetical protein